MGSSRFHGYDEAESEIEIGWTFLARPRLGRRLQPRNEATHASARLPVREQRCLSGWSTECAVPEGHGEDRRNSGRIQARCGWAGEFCVQNHSFRLSRTLCSTTGSANHDPRHPSPHLRTLAHAGAEVTLEVEARSRSARCWTRSKPAIPCCAAPSATTTRCSAVPFCASLPAKKICPTSRPTPRCPTRSRPGRSRLL